MVMTTEYQPASDEQIAEYKRKEEAGESLRLTTADVMALIACIDQERASDYWHGLWKNVVHNLKLADEDLMRRRMAIGGLLVAIGKLPAADLPPEIGAAMATARGVLNGDAEAAQAE